MRNRVKPKKAKDPKLKRKREYQRLWWGKRRQMLIDLLGGKCIDCGSTDLTLLEFDHTDPTTKDFNIRMSYQLARLLPELAKCALRCAQPCHANKTANEEVPF